MRTEDLIREDILSRNPSLREADRQSAISALPLACCAMTIIGALSLYASINNFVKYASCTPSINPDKCNNPLIAGIVFAIPPLCCIGCGLFVCAKLRQE